MSQTAIAQELTTLASQIKEAELPEDLQETVNLRINQLTKLTNSPTFLPEFDRLNKYINWLISLPWNKVTPDNLDLERAKEVLEKHHHGLTEIKMRILEYLAVMKLKKDRGQVDAVMRAPILCFVGLVGTGKTTIAASIAEALGRQFARIPFGGMGDPLDLRGQSRMHAEAEPGKVIKALRQTQSKNPVILLDEIDRVTDAGRASIMGVLVELLDPEQNKAFIDHYIDYPFDLSQVLFIATANNTNNIATAVLDRLEPLSMPSYSDQEKIEIGRRYLLPRALAEAGLDAAAVNLNDEVWTQIVRPLGFDAGIRTLKRNIEGVVRKAALEIVKGKTQSVTITPENVKEYIPQ